MVQGVIEEGRSVERTELDFGDKIKKMGFSKNFNFYKILKITPFIWNIFSIT